MATEPRTTIHESRTMIHEPSTPFNHLSLVMQNKPNLLAPQMNVNSVLPRGYENLQPFSRRENKPNQTQFKANQSQFQGKTNPIKPNFRKAKMDLGNCYQGKEKSKKAGVGRGGVLGAWL